MTRGQTYQQFKKQIRSPVEYLHEKNLDDALNYLYLYSAVNNLLKHLISVLIQFSVCIYSYLGFCKPCCFVDVFDRVSCIIFSFSKLHKKMGIAILEL